MVPGAAKLIFGFIHLLVGDSKGWLTIIPAARAVWVTEKVRRRDRQVPDPSSVTMRHSRLSCFGALNRPEETFSVHTIACIDL
ncbi:hypothetical protein C8R45DRAFT_454089 [Mycena sanguinolenta]|nr:hypothetical protein C8R45DRAFT_454089 [Mycena sanguinolenta]